MDGRKQTAILTYFRSTEAENQTISTPRQMHTKVMHTKDALSVSKDEAGSGRKSLKIIQLTKQVSLPVS